MPYKTLVVLLFSGLISCGDDAPDLSDLAVLEPADLSELADLAPSADLTPLRCESPSAMSYNEYLQYGWQQNGVPGTQQAYAMSIVAVHNDGSIDRSVTPPPVTPDRFACSFTERDIDSHTCLAPCCPGSANQPQPFAPTVYVDKTGWVMWTPGVCAFTIGTNSYIATISRLITGSSH